MNPWCLAVSGCNLRCLSNYQIIQYYYHVVFFYYNFYYDYHNASSLCCYLYHCIPTIAAIISITVSAIINITNVIIIYIFSLVIGVLNTINNISSFNIPIIARTFFHSNVNPHKVLSMAVRTNTNYKQNREKWPAQTKGHGA